MDVLLTQRVEKLGQMGDVVNVKMGYARNFLLPKGKAIRATKEKIEEFNAKKAQYEAQNLQLKIEAETIAEKMQGLSVIIISSAGDNGHLYGSIRAQDIVEAVKEKGFTINRNQVILSHPIKNLGLHPVRLSLHSEVSLFIKVNVALTEEEALAAERKANAQTNSEN